MQATNPEPKRTVALYLSVELVEWIKARARSRRTNASYEAEALLRLARRVEAVRVEAAVEEQTA